MTSDTKRSGLRLAAAGAIGLVFFWLTDPRWGFVGRWMHRDDLIDAINFSRPGTIVGLVGCAIVVIIGMWLASRKAV